MAYSPSCSFYRIHIHPSCHLLSSALALLLSLIVSNASSRKKLRSLDWESSKFNFGSVPISKGGWIFGLFISKAAIEPLSLQKSHLFCRGIRGLKDNSLPILGRWVFLEWRMEEGFWRLGFRSWSALLIGVWLWERWGRRIMRIHRIPVRLFGCFDRNRFFSCKDRAFWGLFLIKMKNLPDSFM